MVDALRPQNPSPKIDPERFPAKPGFATSNKAHRKVNDQAVSNALELAAKADLRGLEAMELPPSPKLKAWHGLLVRELTSQLCAPPKEPGCGTHQLAQSDAKPPTSSSYWVVSGHFLAGAYPGDPDSVAHQKKIQAILDGGIRVFISLMEKNEKDHHGKSFVPYEGPAKEYCPDSECLRFSIRDLHPPSAAGMTTILDTIDQCLATSKPIYLHCWGGVGRTGTVVACWLLRHGLANHDNVLHVLSELRKQDQERGSRTSPESHEQNDFVLAWPPKAGSIVEGNDPQSELPWGEDNYWTDAMETYHRLREDGKTQMILDLAATENVIFNGDGPAYRLMHAMVSVWQREGWEGYRGAPRVLMALLTRLEEISRGHAQSRDSDNGSKE